MTVNKLPPNKIPPNKIPKEDNLVFYGTTFWVRHDTYECILEPSRWILFKWLLRGKAKLRWQVPCDRKRKSVCLKGKLTKRSNL